MPRLDISLQEHIDATEDGNVIPIPYGYARLAEPLDINKDITIVGDKFSVIDTGHSCELLNIENPSATVTIKNVVLVNGKGDNGGIINSNAENRTLVNCILSNSIANNGSSIYSHGGKLHLKDCQITNNFVTYNGPITSLSGDISLEGCTFKNNTALEKGGCIYIKAPATKGLKSSVHRLNMVNSTFIGNDAAELGGVIYSDGTNLLMESCVISRNSGTSLVEILNGRVTRRDCDLSENAGPYNGAMADLEGELSSEIVQP